MSKLSWTLLLRTIQTPGGGSFSANSNELCCDRCNRVGSCTQALTLTVLMTDEKNSPPVISLAAKRKESERDFSQERADLTKELEEIGVTSAALVQHVMLVEWAVYKAALMLDYHSLDRDPRAAVELVKIMLASEK